MLALPYGQAPNQCHPAPSRARRRGNGCCIGSAPPSGRLRLGVSSPSTSTFAPRISAADHPSSPSWTHLRPSRPSSGPGRPWSSLVFVWSSEFGLRRDKFCGLFVWRPDVTVSGFVGAVRRSCAVAAARRRVPDWGSIGTALRILFGGAPAVTTCYRAVTT